MQNPGHLCNYWRSIHALLQYNPQHFLRLHHHLWNDRKDCKEKNAADSAADIFFVGDYVYCKIDIFCSASDVSSDVLVRSYICWCPSTYGEIFRNASSSLHSRLSGFDDHNCCVSLLSKGSKQVYCCASYELLYRNSKRCLSNWE